MFCKQPLCVWGMLTHALSTHTLLKPPCRLVTVHSAGSGCQVSGMLFSLFCLEQGGVRAQRSEPQKLQVQKPPPPTPSPLYVLHVKGKLDQMVNSDPPTEAERTLAVRGWILTSRFQPPALVLTISMEYFP